MFVAQVHSADGRCQQALDAAAASQLITGLQPGSTDTGAYCRARIRLPSARVSDLARRVGSTLARERPGWWPRRGRRVCLVDGATVNLADTPANQAAYPQPGSQAAGLGFPPMRVLGLFCLGSATRLDAAAGGCSGKGSDEQARLGESLGVPDHLLELPKPEKRPDWMSPQEYEQAPDTLKVRQLAAGGKILVTTLS